MEEDDSMFVDYSKGLPEDIDEETRIRLKLAEQYNVAKDMYASAQGIKKRSEAKSIPNIEARSELLAESEAERAKLVEHAKRALTRKSAKSTRSNLGMNEGRGAPKRCQEYSTFD